MIASHIMFLALLSPTCGELNSDPPPVIVVHPKIALTLYSIDSRFDAADDI